MLRLLTRLTVLVIVVGLVLVLYFEFRGSAPEVLDAPAGASGGIVDRERVLEADAELAAKVADGADRAGAALEQARVTAKIKSKMALDDTLESGGLNVDTAGTVVTVSGTVPTAAQKARALQLARETEGVTEVVDRVTVAPAAAR